MALLPVASVPGADLPVRPALAAVVDAVRRDGTAVLVAPPGSGKTSLLPLALADALDGKIIVAEPRRLATRAAAYRLAELIGEQPGKRVGYAMRGERAGGRNSRVEVVTTGLLVARLQRDPDLPGVSAVLIDECHERHLDADLALAFCVDVRATLRPDLALVATSATPDVAAMSSALAVNGMASTVITASTATFTTTMHWTPPPVPLPLLPGARVDRRLLDHVATVTRRALAEGDGDVLVFLPGEAEIAGVVRRLAGDVQAVPLFGRQTRAEQERALTPTSVQRVVVTTSVAESSLTVPGVRAVVDSGLARQPRTDHARGLSALVTTKVSRASADQRAGRAGREAPGRVYRCWSEHEHVHLDAHTPAEIATADLTTFALTVAAWGAPQGVGLALLEPPPVAALTSATTLLRELGAIDADGRITDRGRRIADVRTHPRLARALLDASATVGRHRTSEIVAILSEDGLTGREDDLPARLRSLRGGRDRAATARWREEVRRLDAARDLTSDAHTTDDPTTDDRTTADLTTDERTAADRTTGRMADDLAVGTVVGLAYPDRLARARRSGSAQYQLAGGTGAELDEGSALRGSQWLAVAVADRPVGRTNARIRSAAPIDEATARAIAADRISTVEQIAWIGDGLVARRVETLGAIALGDAPLSNPDPLEIGRAVRDGLRGSGLGLLHWSPAAAALRERMAFCHAFLGAPWPAVDDESLLVALDHWLGPDLVAVRRTADLARIELTTALRRLLPWPAASRLDEFAPERLLMPSGSRARVHYDGGQAPVVSIRVQEAFGATTTPVIADGRAPVVLHLLSPAGRPVAITADLASFWTQGYPQVRADLRARYPRHPWPEDPLSAQPTARARPRR